MNRTRAVAPAGAVLALSLLVPVSVPAQKSADPPVSPLKQLTKEARLAIIRKAQVWTATNIPEMDLKAGPQGPGAFPLNELVACDYVVEAKPSGNSPKFDCAISPGDVVKVKYGKGNGEVLAEVLSTRLLWALGFGADRMYPVRVTCRGCSTDPSTRRAAVGGSQDFDPAAIERKLAGRDIQTVNSPGWTWAELDLVDETQGGAPKAQRDALKLLAVFIQHSDSKRQQQRLICVPLGEAGGECTPFMMLNDVGQTFGNASLFNRDNVSSVNFEGWSGTSVWTGAASCVGRMSKSLTGSLGDPKISEAGRAFLADRLSQLTDQQLQDLFAAAGVGGRSRKPGSVESSATVLEWVAAFKHKRDEVVNRRCES